MILNEPKLEYKSGMPFEAELCHISKTLPHRHLTEMEFIYVLEGSVHLIAAEQDVILTAGKIHSIDFNDIHYIEAAGYNLVLIFHIDLSMLHNWEELKPVFFACESNHCYPYQETAMAQVKDILLSLSYVYFCDQYGDYTDTIYRLMDLLKRYFNWFNYENQDEHMNIELYERFERIMVYIIKNYRQKITVSQLAAREHINRNYFSQFLSKTIFSSFSTMVNFIRCYRAEPLLLTTNMSIADISFECGFSDPKYFYGAFKDLWHRTPTEHRRLYNNCYEAALSAAPAHEYRFCNRKSDVISDDAAASILKEHITLWHLEKNL